MTGNIVAPPADAFPLYPSSWYFFGPAAELANGPASRRMLGQDFVAFRSEDGRARVLDGRCSHMGADLGLGCVKNGNIQCPFHGWEFSVNGTCARIPAGGSVPDFAHLNSYPVIERHGHLFFYNGLHEDFPFPFFDDLDPEDSVASTPITAILNCPWYLVGANAFDLQHFRGAHDRVLRGKHRVETPSPYSRRISLPLSVVGTGLRDGVIRGFAGKDLEMSFTDWRGTMVFSTAKFARTSSRGLVLIQPLADCKTRVDVLVYIRRSGSSAVWSPFDTAHLMIRRWFIDHFLRPDARIGEKGLVYRPEAFTDGDREMIEYFRWLAECSSSASRTTTSRPAGLGSSYSVEQPAFGLPESPPSWYFWGESRELCQAPVAKEALGKTIVAFRNASGIPALLDEKCPHMGASLSLGIVRGDTIECPFHGWRFNSKGCSIGADGAPMPNCSGVQAYPVVERHGLLFFFNGPKALFPLPFFDDLDPADFVRSKPFGMRLNCPWYMIGANAFDTQHFSGAHDRQLVGAPVVEYPTPHACRAKARFAVLGDSWRDRITRSFGGGEVELAITDWCGTVMYVTATFQRTKSHGLLLARPHGPDACDVHGIAFVKKSESGLSALIDPIHARIRRYFIKEFLRPDAILAARGLRLDKQRLIEPDRALGSYFAWLAQSLMPAPSHMMAQPDIS